MPPPASMRPFLPNATFEPVCYTPAGTGAQRRKAPGIADAGELGQPAHPSEFCRLSPRAAGAHPTGGSWTSRPEGQPQ